MQGGSLYHFYDGLWYDPAERRTHDLPCERWTRSRLSQPDTVNVMNVKYFQVFKQPVRTLNIDQQTITHLGCEEIGHHVCIGGEIHKYFHGLTLEGSTVSVQVLVELLDEAGVRAVVGGAQRQVGQRLQRRQLNVLRALVRDGKVDQRRNAIL